MNGRKDADMSTTQALRGGKYLSFALADELYGLEILRVQEIVGMMPVTRVPRLPEFVAGVVNLRGRIIPVIDARSAFRMERAPVTDRTCIIVVNVDRPDGGRTVIGMIVDEVSDVLDLAEEAIEDTPSFGIEVDTAFIRGVGRFEDRVVLLLDIDNVLSNGQLQTMDRVARGASSDEDSEGEA